MEKDEGKKDQKDKKQDIIVRMIKLFRQWYQKRFNIPLQYSSKQAFVIEYNTMKGIYNMLEGSYKASRPNIIPGDDIIFGMWQRLLDYLQEKNNYYFCTLGSIHRSYNTIVAQLMRHQQKENLKKEKQQAAKNQQLINFEQKTEILNRMFNGTQQQNE